MRTLTGEIVRATTPFLLFNIWHTDSNCNQLDFDKYDGTPSLAVTHM